MTEADPCIRSVFGSRRHRFEPRFDEIPPGPMKLEGHADANVRVIEALTKRLYVADVCRYCGMSLSPGENRGIPNG